MEVKDVLRHKVYQDVLDEILKNRLPKSIDEYKIVFSPGSLKGDNYIGIIHRVEAIDIVTNESVLNLIIKLPSENPLRRSEILANLFFTREADFYENLYPIYKKFQEDYGIDVEKNGFHQVPFCYKSLTQEPHEGFFLDDLRVSGFAMHDRLKDLTKDHVMLVMKTLAKMHALFYALKDQKPQLIEKFYGIKDAFISLCDRENSPMDSYFDSLKDQMFEVVDKNCSPEAGKRIKKLFNTKMADLLRDCFKPEHFEPYGTLCHGDCTVNNILFKNDKNGTPIDLRLLDFQIIRFASPVCDVLHFIFACTTKALRDSHYQEFLTTYYDELASFICRLGSNPDKLFPRNVFEDHLKRFSHYGLVMAIIVLPLFTSDVNDLPDMDEIAENFKKISENSEVNTDDFKTAVDKNYQRYAERMKDVCNDMIGLGYV